MILPRPATGQDQVEVNGTVYGMEAILRARIGGHNEMARRRVVEAGLLMAEATYLQELALSEIQELEILRKGVQ